MAPQAEAPSIRAVCDSDACGGATTDWTVVEDPDAAGPARFWNAMMPDEQKTVALLVCQSCGTRRNTVCAPDALAALAEAVWA